MTKFQSIAFISRTILICAAILGAGVFVQTKGQSCESITDQQIVDAIYAKFEANSQLKSQLDRLNVTVVREPVSGTMQAWKVEGWVDDQKDRDKVMDLMYSVYSDLNGIKCFPNIKFNFNSLYTADDVPPGFKSAGGCVGDTKPCGDICIPMNESCNIKGRMMQSN